MGGLFSKKKLFMEVHKLCWANLWGVVLHAGASDQIMSREEGQFHKCIFNYCEHFKFENFQQTQWDIHLKMRICPSYRIMERFLPCSVSLMLSLTWGIDILFQKLTLETGRWILRTLFVHYASVGGDYM